jgi:hypothetical protein
MPVRRALLASVAVASALAVGAPAAGAATFPGWTFPDAGSGGLVVQPCGEATAEGQGSTGHVAISACLGSGLSFIGPSIGQISTVIGPTIIGPATIGVSVQSAGDVAIVP